MAIKKCKGTEKAKGYGCGVELPYTERNGLKSYYSKSGLGIKCGCFYKYDALKEIEKKTKIKPRSKKRQAQEKIYSQLRKAFLSKEENKTCIITGEPTTEIHHMKGRIGDLLTNTKYWIALSRDGHIFVEQNPEWAKKNGYSLSRLSKDD